MLPNAISEEYHQQLLNLTSSKPKLIKASNPNSPSNLQPPTPSPHAAFSAELAIISRKLGAVSSANLIDTYTIIDKRRAMENKLRSLQLKEIKLRAELEDWGSWDARLSRLVNGDGLDSNLGRLNRDVLWFVAELEYRQPPKGRDGT